MTISVTVEEPSSVERLLKITVSPEGVNSVWDQVLGEYMNKAALPGFRQGKAPREMVERSFGDRIRKESLERLVNESFRSSVAEKNLRPLGYPDIVPETKNFERNQAFTYQAKFEIPPKVELKKYKNFKVEVGKVQVRDEDVESEVENLRKRSAALIPLEGRTDIKSGDFVIIDYTATDETGLPLAGIKGENYTVEIGSKSLVPGLEDGLIGAKAGDSREIPVVFPNEMPQENLRGKKAKFYVNVKEIKTRQLPDINDQWLKDVAGKNTLEELKETIKKDLVGHFEKHFDEDVRMALRQELLKSNEVPLPKSLVDHQLYYIVKDFRTRLERQGIPPKAIEEAVSKNLDALTKGAQSQVKVALMLQEIATQEGLRVTAEEVEERLKSWAQSTEMSMDRVREMAEKEGWIDSLRQEILEDRVFGFLKSCATIKEVTQSMSEHRH